MLATTLAGLAGLALAGSAALAQDASTVQVTPKDSVTTTAPNSFDAPQPALTLAAPADPTALRGLKPGQDLVGEDHSHTGSLPAATTDSYFATKDYQQKAEWTRARLRYPDVYGYPHADLFLQGGRPFPGYWTMDYPRSDRHLLEGGGFHRHFLGARVAKARGGLAETILLGL